MAQFPANLDLASITTGDGSLGFVLQGERAGDISGASVASAGDVNGDGFDDLIVGARWADGPSDGRNGAGDSYVIFGTAAGFGATLDLASITTGDGSVGFVLQGERAGDEAGSSVASAGDVNGDGFDDLIVGAPRADGPADGRSDAGDSYVIFGKAGGFGATLDLASITTGDGSLGFVLQGERAVDNSGGSVASAGDVNGDGFDDLIVGAVNADGPADGRGSAGDSYVIFGKAAGFGATLDLTSITTGDGSLGFVLQGEQAGAWAGVAASAGDVNGDGFDDVIVGARYADGVTGDSYVIFGKAGGFGATLDLASIATGDGSLGFVLQGERAGDAAGFSAASAGDVNGDGFADVIVGATGADGPADGRGSAGDSYVIFGKAGGFGATLHLKSITTGDGSLGFVLQGEQSGDWLGWSAASAGDANGDGFDDVIVGTRWAEDSYVIFGKAGGFGATLDLKSITTGDGSLGFVLHGERAGDQSGVSVASAGDVNGDGVDDLIVGAPYADAHGADSGKSYVIFGSASMGGPQNWLGTSADEVHVGSAFADVLNGAGGEDDLQGIGGDDLLIGGKGNDTLDGGVGNDTLHGGVRDDVIRGREGNDVLYGDRGADELFGNEGNDLLYGGARKDSLSGGDGDDMLDGGDGKDTARYDTAAAGVTVSLAIGGAQDTGVAGIDTLISIANLIGSAFADELTGNRKDNTLSGNGGNDILTGGGGNDTFQFDTPLVAGEFTTITDFAAGAEKIAIATSVFTQAGAVGPLAADAFFIGAAAHDASDRIIYNSGTGALLYDADGTGGQAATQFATVSPGLALSAGDFKIV